MAIGFPVVLSSRGIPVTLAENAPSATIADNGLGAPVMIVHEGGAPLNIFVPPPDPDNAILFAQEYDDVAGVGYGYNSLVDPPVGDLIGDLIPGYTVAALFEGDDGVLYICIQGDHVPVLDGGKLSISGTEYTQIHAPTYNESLDVTVAGYDAPVGTIIDGGEYMVSWTPAPPSASVPVNVSPPTVTATPPLINLEETASAGLWQSSSPVTYAYQWQSSDDSGATWNDIVGATASTYTPVFADRQNILRVSVIATNAAGPSDAVYSSPTPKIGPYDFQIYASSYGGIYIGYIPNLMGSLLTPEPIPGYNIAAIITRSEGYSNLSFSGDCRDVIADLVLVFYPPPSLLGDQSDWILSPENETWTFNNPATSFTLLEPISITWEERT